MISQIYHQNQVSTMRPISKALSLVIFRQPTELPPKFSKLCSWLGQISEYWASCWFGLPWLD